MTRDQFYDLVVAVEDAGYNYAVGVADDDTTAAQSDELYGLLEAARAEVMAAFDELVR